MAVEDIPDTGLHIEIDAPADDPCRCGRSLPPCASCRELSAVFDLTRRGAGVHVAGQVSARVGQTCVVSLEPIENDVEETVDLLFAPLPADGTKAEPEIGGTGPKRDEDPPEPLVGGIVDLGAIATEFLILGIDPYPRKAGAQFSPPKADNDGAHPSPPWKR